jgi:hypothetical protein
MHLVQLPCSIIIVIAYQLELVNAWTMLTAFLLYMNVSAPVQACTTDLLYS